jgi:hypothetical protein
VLYATRNKVLYLKKLVRRLKEKRDYNVMKNVTKERVRIAGRIVSESYPVAYNSTDDS